MDLNWIPAEVKARYPLEAQEIFAKAVRKSLQAGKSRAMAYALGYVEAEKANPYHDEKGQFSSGGGGMANLNDPKQRRAVDAAIARGETEGPGGGGKKPAGGGGHAGSNFTPASTSTPEGKMHAIALHVGFKHTGSEKVNSRGAIVDHFSHSDSGFVLHVNRLHHTYSLKTKAGDHITGGSLPKTLASAQSTQRKIQQFLKG